MCSTSIKSKKRSDALLQCYLYSRRPFLLILVRLVFVNKNQINKKYINRFQITLITYETFLRKRKFLRRNNTFIPMPFFFALIQVITNVIESAIIRSSQLRSLPNRCPYGACQPIADRHDFHGFLEL